MVDCIYKRFNKALKEYHSIENKSLKITLNNAIFNCHVLGNGPEIIIAFHGVGQDGEAFLPVVLNNPKYTLYSFDLPFHGETIIPINSKCISRLQVVELISKLIKITKIKSFSILGFSIGAKFVFPILDKYSHLISNVWLLAPDGIYINYWYRLATGTLLSRNIFRMALKYPLMVEKMGEVLNSLSLIDKRTLLFFRKSINTEKKRLRLYYTWSNLRKLIVIPNDLIKSIDESNLVISIFLGEYDEIISKSKIEHFMKGISGYKVIMLLCEHHDLIKCFANNPRLNISGDMIEKV